MAVEPNRRGGATGEGGSLTGVAAFLSGGGAPAVFDGSEVVLQL
jgi:hypothetical protein